MRRLLTIALIGLMSGFATTSLFPNAYADPTWQEGLGNDSAQTYRPPWRERDQWQRSDGCGVNDHGSGCGAHLDINQWAIDLNKANDCGAPLRADRLGSVRLILEWASNGYGNLLGITHYNGPGDLDSSWYAHLQAFPSNQPWDTVFAQGDFIGLASSTGHVIPEGSCHLHFQVDDTEQGPDSWSGYNTLNAWFGVWPSYGYDIQHLSTDATGWHASNNTGPGYGRPYTGTCSDPLYGPGQLCLDRGPENEPKSWPIRTLARNAAAFAVDIGSTRAAMQGPCAANRRWVKGCYFNGGVYRYTQSFVVNYQGLEFPQSITEGYPDGTAYRVTKAMWKAYGRSCRGNPSYLSIGRPIGEEFQIGTYMYEQDFQYGWLFADRSDPAARVTVTVASSAYGNLCTIGAIGGGGLYDWLDSPKEPCYDVNSDGIVNIADVTLVAKRMDTNETDPINHNPSYPGYDYDDRYDALRDGYINIGDVTAVARQGIAETPSRVCR